MTSLIPGPGNVTLFGKRSADLIKLNVMQVHEKGDYPGLSQQALNVITSVLVGERPRDT